MNLMFGINLHSRISPVSGFSPASISGLKAWHAARFIDGLNDNDPIVLMEDQSGNNNIVEQTVADSRPVYKVNIIAGKPVARFNGLKHLVKTGGVDYGAATGFHVFGVARQLVPMLAACHVCLKHGATVVQQRWDGAVDGTKPETIAFYAGTGIATATFAHTGWNIHESIYDDASNELMQKINGDIDGTASDNGAFSINVLVIGSRDGVTDMFNGDLAEWLVFNRRLTDEEADNVRNYLFDMYTI